VAETGRNYTLESRYFSARSCLKTSVLQGPANMISFIIQVNFGCDGTWTILDLIGQFFIGLLGGKVLNQKL
jgi:hypothetical protein